MVFCLIAFSSQLAVAVSTEDRLLCHEDPSLANEQGVSLHVDPETFQNSIHGEAGIECADCHFDLDPTG